MNLSALCHIPKSNYAYAYRNNELHIRLRTAKDDMDQVFLYYGIKYDWQNKQHDLMEKVLSDEFYDYYEYHIVSDDSRLGYYFGLEKGNEVLYYTEAGIVTEFDDSMAYCYFFQYPFINEVDVHKEPEWVGTTTFYQIFVERFYNGDVKNSPSPLTPWDADPTPKSFYGGDLMGIIKKMDYLVELGVTGIYLTPIFESISNHKYDISDYMEVDHYFGSKDTLRELIELAHKNGIRIVLDAVFNHCGEGFAPFQDVLKNGKKSKYWDWFFIEDEPVSQTPANYLTFSIVPYMPKLNTANEEVKEYLHEVIRYWTEEFHIDGWRLDVSDEIDHQFWRDMRQIVKSINPQAILIGENWHDAYPWLKGDQFDSVMNYPLTKLSLDYFARNIINAKTFTNEISRLLTRYPKQVNEAMLNLLDSHDTERFLTTCKGNTRSLMNAAAFLYAYKGMPCTYYGTEIGLDGVYDPGCRKGFDWNEEHWDKKLYSFYRKIIAIRNQEKAFQFGEVKFYSSRNLFVMRRKYEQEEIYVVINQTDQTEILSSDQVMAQTYVDLLSGEEVVMGKTYSIKPKELLYLKKKM